MSCDKGLIFRQSLKWGAFVDSMFGLPPLNTRIGIKIGGIEWAEAKYTWEWMYIRITPGYVQWMRKAKSFSREKSEELEDAIKEIPGNKTVILEPTTVTMPIATRIRKTVNVKLAHPLKTKLTAESKKKTDKVDAKVLADLAGTSFLPEAYLPPDDIAKRNNQGKG